MTRSLPLVALALAIAVAVLATEARVVVGGKTWDDATYQTEIVPARLAAARSTHQRIVPAWWDGAGLGVPLAAEPSHGSASPAMWLAVTPLGLDLVMVFHLVWFALGIAAWSRRAGATDLGAFTAAVLIATTGLVAATALRGALPALAHLPWIAWCASRLAAAERPRDAARDAVGLGILIAFVGVAGQFGLLVDAVVIASVLGATHRTWRYLVLGLVGGVAISALQWVPALALHTAGATITGMSPARLVELLVPGSFGSPDPAHGVPAFASTGLPSMFVGAALLGLGAVSRARDRRSQVLTVGFVIAALVVGRGGWPAWIGAPELHLAVYAMFVAVRAARGVELFVTADNRALIALAIAAGVAAIVTWTMIALRDTSAAGTGGAQLDAVIWRAVATGGIGAGMILGAVVLAKLAPKLRFLALALLVLPNLGALGATAPVIDRFAAPRWAAVITSSLDRAPHRLYRNAQLEKTGEPSAEEAIATLAGEAAARWGVAAVRTDDPGRSPQDDATWKASAHGGGELLERFGIEFAVLPASVVTAEKLTELDRRALWSIARWPAAPPATVLTNWVWIADDAAALAKLFPATGGRGIPANSTILRGTGEPPNNEQPAHASTCELVSWDPGAIDLACDAAGAGYAVISSASAPGWSVEVDGVARPWVTADVLRRAVAVPAGKHAVRWRYAMPGRRAAQVLALAGLVMLAGLGFLAQRR